MEEDCSVQFSSQAILAACSSDYVQVKQAEQMIQELEVKRGFFPILAEMALASTVPLDMKRMAAICLKNGVSKFWRSMSPNALGKEDKENIRRILLGCYAEGNKEVFGQLIEVVAKISRYDFPKNWSDFIPTLVQVVESDPEEENKLRALTLIYKVIKTLSTKRLSGDKKAFRETTGAIFAPIGSLWEKYLRLFNSRPVLLHLQTSLVTLKLLRSMLTYGFEDISSAHPQACLEALLKFASSQLDHRLTMTDPAVKDVYDKYLLVVVKTFINIQEKFPDGFGQYIVVALEFAYKIGFQFAELLETRLVARALHLTSGIMLCETYDVFKLNNRGKDVSSISIKLTEERNSFFTEQRLQEMCVKCISKYLKLSELELQNWQELPEEFAYEETRHVSLFNIKAASEHFLLNLTATFQDTVCPYIISLIKECAKHDRANLETVLMIDSIYSVTVICSYDLFDYIDIDNWFLSLLEELKAETPFCAILRRRIIEVIGRWVTIKLSQDHHPAVYEVCLQHMNKDQDLVVRLTSASALQAAVSDFAFYPPAFSPYLEPTMQLLYALLREAEECESRVKILEVLNAVIDGCGKDIVQFVDPLIQWLPSLWEVAGEHTMLQTQLLHTAKKLTRCLGPQSVKLYPFTDPVLHYAITQDPELVLLEDGISLWLMLLENAPCGTQHFAQMFTALNTLVQMGSDSLKTTLLIIECTILLDPRTIIPLYGESVVGACVTLYQDVVGEGKVLIDNIVLTIMKTCPRETWPNLTPIFLAILTDINQFSDYSKVLTMNLNVLCYLILIDMSYFNNLITSISGSSPIFKNLFEIWMSKTEHFYRIEQHKLSLIALLTFVTNQPDLVRLYFKDLIGVIERAVEKSTDIDEDSGVRYDCILRKHASKDDDLLTGETEDYKRRKILEETDLVSKVDVLTFVRAKFLVIQQIIGKEMWDKLLKDVDKDVTQKLTGYLS